ncbi:MAG: biotin/lipoyl-containing protein [Gammaproteobacteria bacterium]|nr:biotin/lipoyl-containing protein [Gammaproteobacteria bacterium]
MAQDEPWHADGHAHGGTHLRRKPGAGFPAGHRAHQSHRLAAEPRRRRAGSAPAWSSGDDRIGVHYDPMLAKVIAHGHDRDEALTRLDRALADTRIAGVEHNVAFLRRLLADATFRRGDYSTHLVEEAGEELLPERDMAGWVCAALALQRSARDRGAWGAADGFRLNRPSGFAVDLERDEQPGHIRVLAGAVEIDDLALALEDPVLDAGRVSFRLDGQVVRAAVVVSDDAVYVMRQGDTERFRLPHLDVAALAESAGGAEQIVAPMPGQVIAVSVQPGDSVSAGQVLLVIEAMKMEHSVTAPRAGTVAAVSCAEGDRVDDGVELITLEA